MPTCTTRPRLHLGRPVQVVPAGALSLRDQMVLATARPDAVPYLAGCLHCREEAVAELLGFWLPRGPSGLLGVFANALKLDATLLRRVVEAHTPAAGRPQEPTVPLRPEFPAAAEAPRTGPPKVTWRRARPGPASLVALSIS